MCSFLLLHGAETSSEIQDLRERYEELGDGTFTAHFGYLNQTSSPITVPLGSMNMFVPPPNDRGQPTVFLPGENDFVFQVVFDGTFGQEIKWMLKADGDRRHQVEASATSEPCPAATTTVIITTTPTTTTTPDP